MKKSIFQTLILASFLLASASITTAQPITDYFKYEGVELLATLAHPTNTFRSGSFNVGYNEVVIEIYYEEGYETKLKLYRSGPFFTRLVVLRDTDWWPPFAAVSLIKTLADDLIQSVEYEEQQEVKSKLEIALRKKWYDFDGEDLSLFILSADWMSY